MLAAWIVETVDVFEDRQFSGRPGWPWAASDQLGLDRLEETLIAAPQAPTDMAILSFSS
jgi:hypothetical protein